MLENGGGFDECIEGARRVEGVASASDVIKASKAFGDVDACSDGPITAVHSDRVGREYLPACWPMSA